MLLPNSELKNYSFSKNYSLVNLKFPNEFPPLVESVANSLRDGYQDYCFSKDQLKEISMLCHEKRVSFFYDIFYDKIGHIDYIQIIPVVFHSKLNKNKKLNIQCAYSEIPKEYSYDIIAIEEEW